MSNSSSNIADAPPALDAGLSPLDAAGLVGTMQRELRAVSVALPVISAKTMARQLEESLVGTFVEAMRTEADAPMPGLAEAAASQLWTPSGEPSDWLRLSLERVPATAVQ